MMRYSDFFPSVAAARQREREVIPAARRGHRPCSSLQVDEAASASDSSSKGGGELNVDVAHIHPASILRDSNRGSCFGGHSDDPACSPGAAFEATSELMQDAVCVRYESAAKQLAALRGEMSRLAARAEELAAIHGCTVEITETAISFAVPSGASQHASTSDPAEFSALRIINTSLPEATAADTRASARNSSPPSFGVRPSALAGSVLEDSERLFPRSAPAVVAQKINDGHVAWVPPTSGVVTRAATKSACAAPVGGVVKMKPICMVVAPTSAQNSSSSSSSSLTTHLPRPGAPCNGSPRLKVYRGGVGRAASPAGPSPSAGCTRTS